MLCNGSANNAGYRFDLEGLKGCGGELWSVGLVPDIPVTDSRVVGRLRV